MEFKFPAIIIAFSLRAVAGKITGGLVVKTDDTKIIIAAVDGITQVEYFGFRVCKTDHKIVKTAQSGMPV